MKPMTTFPIQTRVQLGNTPSKWGNSPRTMDILGQCDCDCASDCACAPENSSPRSQVPFKNHEDVLKILLSRDKRYILIDAPAGYGKSRLLTEAQKQLKEKGYQCLYIDLSEQNSEDSIREKIKQGFGFDLSRASDHDTALRGKLSTKPEPFALVLDTIEYDQQGDLIRWFYEKIAKPLYENRVANYKIILAGRHVQMTGNPYNWDEWRAVTLSKQPLPAIQPRHILEILEEYPAFGVQKSEFLWSVARNIARLSGGHPGIIVKLVEYWLDNGCGEGFAPKEFNKLKDIWNVCATDEFNKMLVGLTPDEQSLLKEISIFRQMTQDLLETLCQKVGITIDYHTAWSKLTSKHIFIQGDVFWQDGVVRQVMARQLELTENNEYQRLHGIALELWEGHLRKVTEHEWRVNALRNTLYHAINSGMTKSEIAQRIADDLRSIYVASTEQMLSFYEEANFKEEDLEHEHRWFEYLETCHKEHPSAEEIRLLLLQQLPQPPATPSHPTGETHMEIKIDAKLLDALARTLDFLRQNAENVLIERWEKRNQGKAITPPIFRYGEGGEQEIKQSLQALPAVPGRVKLSDNRIILLTPQHLQNLQQAMLNAQDSMGRLGAELANLTSAVERATLKQQIDSYKAQFDNATAELAEIYVHIYSPQ